MIRLVGPGGAGKSTTGVLLAKRLVVSFFDLDQYFTTQFGDISEYIARQGYESYVRNNIEVYRSLLCKDVEPAVLTLSSGFMAYPSDAHPEYRSIRNDIEQAPKTFVLLPSLDQEVCVAETVRRQLQRPFAGSEFKEEAVIRARFPIYMAIPARKITTMRPTPAVVEEIVAALDGCSL
jgi:shikimate kinase